MARKRQNFITGTVADNPLLISATTLNSTGLANLQAITGPDVAVLVLDPQGVNGAPEIIYVTAHTASATSATISRARESTTARQHLQGIAWVHAMTISDPAFVDQANTFTAGQTVAVPSGGTSLAVTDSVHSSLYVKHTTSGYVTFDADPGNNYEWAVGGVQGMQLASGGALTVKGAGAGGIGITLTGGDISLAAGTLRFASTATKTTAANAGTATALPALPSGYISVLMDATTVKIPYFAA